MKEFINIMKNDIQSENFTKREYVVYGIIVPIVLVVVMAIAGYMDSIV